MTFPEFLNQVSADGLGYETAWLECGKKAQASVWAGKGIQKRMATAVAERPFEAAKMARERWRQDHGKAPREA